MDAGGVAPVDALEGQAVAGDRPLAQGEILGVLGGGGVGRSVLAGIHGQ